jgi:metal-responsive CopG/Arc/MetJ family transcriptional regulator
MAVLKADIKRITMSVPKSFLKDLDTHLKNFATDRSRWLLEAAREKIAREKLILSELEQEKDDL